MMTTGSKPLVVSAYVRVSFWGVQGVRRPSAALWAAAVRQASWGQASRMTGELLRLLLANRRR